jgi:hypothetical protein
MPEAGDWKEEEILTLIQSNLSLNASQPVRVEVVAYNRLFGDNNLRYFARSTNIPLEIGRPAGPNGPRRIVNADFIVYDYHKEQRRQVKRLAQPRRRWHAVMSILDNPPPLFNSSHRLIGTFTLPDSGEVRVFKRTSPPTETELQEVLAMIQKTTSLK